MLGSALFKDFAPEFLTDLESYCKVLYHIIEMLFLQACHVFCQGISAKNVKEL